MSKVKEFYLAQDYLPEDEPLEEPVVTEDDWELGPVCQLGDEECEACQ